MIPVRLLMRGARVLHAGAEYRFNERWHGLNAHPNWLFYWDKYPPKRVLAKVYHKNTMRLLHGLDTKAVLGDSEKRCGLFLAIGGSAGETGETSAPVPPEPRLKTCSAAANCPLTFWVGWDSINSVVEPLVRDNISDYDSYPGGDSTTRRT